MNIIATYDIINFDSKIEKIYKTADIEKTDFDPIVPDGQYNATCKLFTTKDNVDCVLGYCSSSFEQVNDPKTILFFDKEELSENSDFIELHLYASNGNYYIYFTKIITYLNNDYFLIDINNLKAEEYNGDQEFYFFDYNRGVKSNIITSYTYQAQQTALIYNQFDTFTIDRNTEDLLIKDYRGDPLIKKESPVIQNITLNDNNYIYGGYTTNSAGSKIYNLIDYNNQNYSYNRFNYNTNKITQITTQNTWTYFKNNQLLNSNNVAYQTTGSLRNCIGQSEVIDFNYNNYINFEAPYISYELLLLPITTIKETKIELDTFAGLENLNLNATTTLGAIFTAPIIILFFTFLRKIIF